MTPISFTARYIRPANIKKLDGDSYKPHTASIVEMELSDIQAIEDIAFDWQQPVSTQLYKHSLNMGKDGIHVYAVTNQKDGFGKIDCNRVLGMMLYKEAGATDTHNTIEYLQVAPSDMSEKNNGKLYNFIDKIMSKIFKVSKQEHKNVGTALIDIAKDAPSEKPIDLYAVPGAIKFYLKNGFMEISGSKKGFLRHMEWLRP